MTKRILKTLLWNRLFTRFKTEDLEDDIATLLETVQPITNFDELTKEIKTDAVDLFVTPTTTPNMNYNIHTVPKGKRYKIYAIDIIRQYGDGTIDSVSVNDPDGDPIVIFWAAAAAGISTKLLNLAIPLDEGQMLMIHVDTITVISSWELRLYREEEDTW